MRTGSAICVLLCIGVAVCSGQQLVNAGRKLQMGDQGVGRQLLDINVTSNSSFTLTAFGSTGQTPGGNCYLQGFPGSRADSTVAGPLTVKVYPNEPVTISFSRGSDDLFANYNYSGNVAQVTVDQNSSYGLASVTFTPNAVGQYANVFSGLVASGNAITLPICLVNISFVTVALPSPPPSPSTPTPPSSPTPAGSCSGVIPCYCQNGYCFLNGATLSQNCKPPAGETCTPVSISPSTIGIQYATGYGSTVNVCKCSS